MISKRAARTLQGAPLVSYHFLCELDPSKKITPQMIINFGTAENYLPDKINQKKKEELSTLKDLTRKDMHYNQLQGPLYFRQIVAKFGKQFFNINLNPNNITICAGGASASLQMLGFCLMDQDQKLVLLRPFYNGYLNDLVTRFRANSLACDFYDLYSDEKNFDALEELFKKQRPKVVVCNNPSNPTGHMWKVSQMQRLIDLCEKYQVEIIADEVCAGLAFSQPFTSMLTLNRYKQHIHWLYGLSKDFGLAGFKIGMIYTENQQIQKAILKSVYFHTACTLTLKFVSQIMGDFNHVRNIFSYQQQTLKKNFEMLKKKFASVNIRVTPSAGGMFCLISLKQHGVNTKEEELQMTSSLIQDPKVYIAPGVLFNPKQFGWFRFCFRERP